MSSAVDLKSKEEKDAELDKRIEALRKKNEALMKRYQEIEEDRKKAEQEGIAVTTPRKIKQLEDEPSKRRKEKENFSITIGLNSAEKRVVRDRGSPNSSSDAPCSPDQTFPRSPPHRIRGGIGRSPCIERSDIPSWEASGGLGGGVRGERGRRSRGGRSRGSARERIGGGKRGGRFREWEERGEGGELFGEREETVGRFSGRPSSDKEERSSRFCEREEYGGGDDKKVGRFIEQVENDGAREEQGGRSSRWEYKRGRGSHRGGTMSEKEEKGGKGNDLGGSFCEREDLGGGDREGRRGGGVGKLKQGGKSGRGIGGGGVKECGSGSDEWGSGGGDSDEWGIGGAGGDEWVGGNESRECSGRVRGGALDGKGGIVKAKKTGSIAFSEHREESGSMGPSSEGGGVGGPERKVKDWEEKRRQNIEKMNEEMEKIAEYERSQREGVREKNPFRNFLDDPRRCGPIIEIDRKEGSRRHVRNWGGSDFDRLKTGLEREKVPHGRRQSPRNADDMTLSMTGRERAEYMRWKTEREQIDQERLARHRKPTGQWRREWDAEKNESMFKEGSAPVIASDEGNRFDENKRPPKPPTFGDFSAEGKAPSSGKNKGRPRERRPPKAYSMHDNRWEENAAQLEGVAVEKESNVEKQEEIKNATLPDNTEQQDVDDDDQWEDASEDEEEMFGEEEYEEEIVEEEAVVVNEEEEKDKLVGLVMEREQKQQEKQTVKVDDAKNVVVKKDDTNKQAQSLPAEPTKNERTPAPKLTIDIPVEATVEKSLESKPLSPFSPDGGHNPVLDWGAEMDNELRTPQSSSEDSPPQADTRTSHRVGSDASESQKNSLSDVFEAPGVNSPEDLTRFSHPQDVREDTEEARCFSHTRKSTEYVKNETECEASDTAQTVETAECERENHPVTE